MRPISSMALAATRSSCCLYLCTPSSSSSPSRGGSAKVSPYPSCSSSTPLSTPLVCFESASSWSTSEPLSSRHLCGVVPLRRLRAKKSGPVATVGTEDVVVEPVTNVKFPTLTSAPGGSKQLRIAGAGFREKTIAFIGVKVYAVGIYIDASISLSLSAWKGKTGEELSKDTKFFKVLAEAPVEKSIKIVLVRDVDGATFWGALDDALAPRLKAANAGAAGQEALADFGKLFQGRPLKQGTAIFLTWVQPSMLQVAISGDGSTPPDVGASIDSAALLSALFDVYLGESPVSPTAKAAVAFGLAPGI